MKKHYYARTAFEALTDTVLAFNSKDDREAFLKSYRSEGYWLISVKEARTYKYVKHFYAKAEHFFYSQTYPRKMWF